ncbi:HAD family hydrolase [Phenylobacterium sp.]|uniref:HAD family hydrolase n=1 Tax=Phenylobacterium sp. TaxID=1871053 RepID=UPI00289A8796|nr:HAD family hydrolase [Phenylobacterium sp.]
MTPPTVLLDLDGTLVDSLPGIEASGRAALAALGHAPDSTLDIAAMIGPPIEDMMRLMLARYGDDRIAEGVAAYRADYGQRGLLGSHPYPGVAEAMAALRETGARLILATSKRREFAERILAHTGFDAFFAAVHGSEPGGDLDHKPELIAHIARRHGLAPGRCVMVGDRRHDIAGAHANAVRALGVLWGYGTREELETAGADGLVAAPDALATAVLALVSSSASGTSPSPGRPG